MTRMMRPSCWHKNFGPNGLYAPVGAIRGVFKNKVDFNCWHQSFVTWGLSAPDPRLHTCIKSWKDVYKIRGLRDFFLNLQQMTRVMRPSCWHKNFGPIGLSAPVGAIRGALKNKVDFNCTVSTFWYITMNGGARWLSGRVSDSGARGRGFETYRRRVVSLSKTLYSPKVLVNYPGSSGSVPTWQKNCWLGC